MYFLGDSPNGVRRGPLLYWMWIIALLAPRFIASAFASGPALMILGLKLVRAFSRYPVRQSVIEHLALTMTVALQITLFFVAVELFTDFYNEGAKAGIPIECGALRRVERPPAAAGTRGGAAVPAASPASPESP